VIEHLNRYILQDDLAGALPESAKLAAAAGTPSPDVIDGHLTSGKLVIGAAQRQVLTGFRSDDRRRDIRFYQVLDP
jgi:hypothetical protein